MPRSPAPLNEGPTAPTSVARQQAATRRPRSRRSWRTPRRLLLVFGWGLVAVALLASAGYVTLVPILQYFFSTLLVK